MGRQYVADVLDSQQAWYEISWVEWISVIGVPLAIAGLVVTWRQAYAASDAARAAELAVRKTRAQLRSNQLMAIVPQLRFIAVELDAAIASENGSLARRQLDAWRSQAGHAHGLLSSVDSADYEDILQKILESVGLAAAAGTALLQDRDSPTLKKCARARQAIGAVCDRLTMWAGENATHIPTGDRSDE
ncbi:MAG: hypothetical protein JXA57_11380 [Armatimonadetes bacterium]|nr:hypothetical protein [Armatimonadota bacterium]